MKFTRWWTFNQDLQVYPITIKITNPTTHVSIVKNCIYDTGFSGYLGIDSETISALNLKIESKGKALTISGEIEYKNYSVIAEIMDEKNQPLYQIRNLDDPSNQQNLSIPIQEFRIPLLGLKAINQFNWILLSEKKWIGLFE